MSIIVKYAIRIEPLLPMRRLHQTEQKGKLSLNKSRREWRVGSLRQGLGNLTECRWVDDWCAEYCDLRCMNEAMWGLRVAASIRPMQIINGWDRLVLWLDRYQSITEVPRNGSSEWSQWHLRHSELSSLQIDAQWHLQSINAIWSGFAKHSYRFDGMRGQLTNSRAFKYGHVFPSFLKDIIS